MGSSSRDNMVFLSAAWNLLIRMDLRYCNLRTISAKRIRQANYDTIGRRGQEIGGEELDLHVFVHNPAAIELY